MRRDDSLSSRDHIIVTVIKDYRDLLWETMGPPPGVNRDVERALGAPKVLSYRKICINSFEFGKDSFFFFSSNSDIIRISLNAT